MEVEIRSAEAGDAEGISSTIIAALRETNARDYPLAVIKRIENNFSAQAVEALIEQRTVFVALKAGVVIGTASLDGHVLRTVFVRPDYHRQGVGSQLMAVVVQAALAEGIEVLKVPSSVTAESFYQRLGFAVVGERFHQGERTIVMELKLPVRTPDQPKA